jgi:hypothetical protein
MSFHGVWDAQAGWNLQSPIAVANGVDGGVRVFVPIQKAVFWHTFGPVQLCQEIGSS